ncbi:unnamed protein product [Echinostoma caproni]|uniref:NAB co-repressor domain-containing protein n=1 Tax=Echinostoma caproni TaxID=27848 RepID=A0A3P8KVJ7_9TREM|nr:unnamed protein product [Echinostoma caproni]
MSFFTPPPPPPPPRPTPLQTTPIFKSVENIASLYFSCEIGGDDVQQLVELLQEPEEFADLLKLVGMDKKPLHVRRFKKALRESFNSQNKQNDDCSRTVASAVISDTMDKLSTDLFPSPNFPFPTISSSPLIACTTKRHVLLFLCWLLESRLVKLILSLFGPDSPSHHPLLISALSTPVASAPSPPTGLTIVTPATTKSNSLPPIISPGQQPRSGRSSCEPDPWSAQIPNELSTQNELNGMGRQFSQPNLTSPMDESSNVLMKTEMDRVSSPISFVPDQLMFHLTSTNNPSMALRPSASLLKADMEKLTAAVNAMIPHLPSFPLRQMNTRSINDKEIQEILKLPLNDPIRLDGLRRHSTIFGRFDAPKRLTRPLRHFEVCVNEITHRLVRQIPELVTQREHLFHIARQIFVVDCSCLLLIRKRNCDIVTLSTPKSDPIYGATENLERKHRCTVTPVPFFYHALNRLSFLFVGHLKRTPNG